MSASWIKVGLAYLYTVRYSLITEPDSRVMFVTQTVCRLPLLPLDETQIYNKPNHK